jgi:hypothetical protein
LANNRGRPKHAFRHYLRQEVAPVSTKLPRHSKLTRLFHAADTVGGGSKVLGRIRTNVKLRASYIRHGKSTHLFYITGGIKLLNSPGQAAGLAGDGSRGGGGGGGLGDEQADALQTSPKIRQVVPKWEAGARLVFSTQLIL